MKKYKFPTNQNPKPKEKTQSKPIIKNNEVPAIMAKDNKNMQETFGANLKEKLSLKDEKIPKNEIKKDESYISQQKINNKIEPKANNIKINELINFFTTQINQCHGIIQGLGYREKVLFLFNIYLR